MDKVLTCLIDYVHVKGLTRSFALLLIELLSFKNKNGKIVINASLKRDIGHRINASVGSIDNMITKLVETAILLRIDRGMYMFSEELDGFTYADKSDIEMKITYNDKAKKIKIIGGRKQ